MTEQYIDYVITDRGRELIARVIAGETISFKRFAIGDGFEYDTSIFPQKAELTHEVLSVNNLTKEDVGSAKVVIKGSFNQTQLEEEFYYREIGLYVVDPDDETSEILFAYGNKNDKAELIIPGTSSYVVSKRLNCHLTIGKSANVNIYIAENATANVINFLESEWTREQDTGFYKVYIGEIQESIKVFRTVEGAKYSVPMSEIIRTGNNETSVRALVPFDGCVVCL